MFLGLRTSIHPVTDLAAARRWFATTLGVEPYFDEPFYVGFDIGGFELGLLPGADQADGVQTYWGVPDADAAMKHLLDAGAAPHTPVTDVGGGIRTALVRVPDAGLLGIIENPHFKTPAA